MRRIGFNPGSKISGDLSYLNQVRSYDSNTPYYLKMLYVVAGKWRHWPFFLHGATKTDEEYVFITVRKPAGDFQHVVVVLSHSLK